MPGREGACWDGTSEGLQAELGSGLKEYRGQPLLGSGGVDPFICLRERERRLIVSSKRM